MVDLLPKQKSPTGGIDKTQDPKSLSLQLNQYGFSYMNEEFLKCCANCLFILVQSHVIAAWRSDCIA